MKEKSVMKSNSNHQKPAAYGQTGVHPLSGILGNQSAYREGQCQGKPCSLSYGSNSWPSIIGNSSMLQAGCPVIQRIRIHDMEPYLLEQRQKYGPIYKASMELMFEDDPEIFAQILKGFPEPVKLQLKEIAGEKMCDEWRYTVDAHLERLCNESLGQLSHIESENGDYILQDDRNFKNKLELLLKAEDENRIRNFSTLCRNAFLHARKYLAMAQADSGNLPEAWREALSGIDDKRIGIRILDADAHGFMPPLELEVDGLMLVLKDRLGFADKEVTDLFQKINTLLKNTGLPAYEQYAFHPSGLLSQFISGTRPKMHASEILKNGADAEKHLMMLQWVAKEIGLTDLHLTNVLISGDYVYPVDLEAFDMGMETGLFPGGRAPKDLDPNRLFDEKAEAVKGMVAESRQRLFELPKRYVPVSTAKYLDAWKLKEPGMVAQQMTALTVEAMRKSGYEVDDTILSSIMNEVVSISGGIPIFTTIRYENRIYSPNQGIWVSFAEKPMDSSREPGT